MSDEMKLFFRPESVAVVGASRTPGKVGHDILSNLIRNEYGGKIFPVNPKAEDILGLKSYPSVAAVEPTIDLAILVTPARSTLDVLDECIRKNVKAAIVISAGFKETGPEGAALETELAARARQAGMRIVGPNCLGLIDAYSRLNVSFAADMPARGNISFLSQSGALCTAILDWALSEEAGFSRIVSLGNKCDVDETDILQALAEDDRTEVILGYIEALKDGARFMRAAKEVSKKKPIIIAKSGKTRLGAGAASSHTGSLAGSSVAYETAFAQSGIVWANTMQDLVEYAQAFSYQPPPSKPGLLIVTNAGGPGILALDAAAACQVRTAALAETTKADLRAALPPTASVGQLIDVLGDAKADRYELVLEKAMEDESVGGILVLLTPQSTTQVEETAKAVAAVSRRGGKTVLASFMGKEGVESGLRALKRGKVPNYSYPERAVIAFRQMSRYAGWRSSPFAPPETLDVDRERAAAIIAAAVAASRSALDAEEIGELLSAYGIRAPHTVLARDETGAVECARGIGFPVVLKVSSQEISHKSDAGGVRIGIHDERGVRAAFREIMQNCAAAAPHARIDGVAVQEMIQRGKELIVGGRRDPQFGPVIMFGLGGIYVETLQDVSHRIAPLSLEDTTMMLREIRSFPILTGVRGEEPSDIEAIQQVILRVSRLMEDHPEIGEMDINPLKALPYGKGVVAVDARIMLGGKNGP